MITIFRGFLVGVVALCLAACGEEGRKYPPGYTDEGVKFAENGWRFFPSDEMGWIVFEGDGGRPQITFQCRIRSDGQLANLVAQNDLEIGTGMFEPLQQWPQPDIEVTVGSVTASRQAELQPRDTGNPGMTIKIGGRVRDQIVKGLEQGLPITLTFADQTLEVHGPPQSMREAFAEKCLAGD